MDRAEMLELARKALETAGTPRKTYLPAPLVYVVETARGNVYTVVNDEFDGLLRTLAERDDRVVSRVLAMFKGSLNVDIPSFDFRAALMALDPANAETELMMQRRTMTIEAAMPPKKTE